MEGVAVVGEGAAGGGEEVAVGLVDHDEVRRLHDAPLDPLRKITRIIYYIMLCYAIIYHILS